MKKYKQTIGELYGIRFVAKKLSLWERIRLFFKKPMVSTDWATGDDKSVRLISKQLGDKIYILDEYVGLRKSK